MITSCSRVYSIEEYGNPARFKASSAPLPTTFRNDDGTITWRFDEAVPDVPKAGSLARGEGDQRLAFRGNHARFR